MNATPEPPIPAKDDGDHSLHRLVSFPRTDAKRFEMISDLQSGYRYVVTADFAMQLERELAAWRNCAERLRPFAIHYSTHPHRNHADKLAEVLAEFDQLRGANEKAERQPR